MEAFFRLPVASSSADSLSSSLSDGGGSVGVGDGDGGGAVCGAYNDAFFLDFLLGSMTWSWRWEPVVSSAEA